MKFFIFAALISLFSPLRAMNTMSSHDYTLFVDALLSGDHRALNRLGLPIAGYPIPENKVKIFTFNNATLLNVKNKVQLLLNQGIALHEILVILDNDGTLTKSKEPAVKANQRGKASAFVNKLRELNIDIIVSSAWNDFEQTLDTLEQIDIADSLLVDRNEIKEINFRTSINRDVKGFRSGLVCSLKYANSDKYFRQKALTPLAIFEENQIKKYKYIIFADDSNTNIQTFANDVLNLPLANNVEVLMYALVPSIDEPWWPAEIGSDES